MRNKEWKNALPSVGGSNAWRRLCNWIEKCLPNSDFWVPYTLYPYTLYPLPTRTIATSTFHFR